MTTETKLGDLYRTMERLVASVNACPSLHHNLSIDPVLQNGMTLALTMAALVGGTIDGQMGNAFCGLVDSRVFNKLCNLVYGQK